MKVRVPQKAPRNLQKTNFPVQLTGDEIMDDLFVQTLYRLESDRREADDLYEMIRQNAETMPDDPAMSHTAVQALRVKHGVTSQATRLLDIASRYKVQREKLEMQRGDDDSELLNLLDDDEEQDVSEDKKQEEQPEEQSEEQPEDKGNANAC